MRTRKRDKDIEPFILEVVEFGEKYHIKKEINVQKLMVLELKMGLLQKEMEEKINEILVYDLATEDSKIVLIKNHLNGQ